MCDVAPTGRQVGFILFIRKKMSDEERATDRWENEGGHRFDKSHKPRNSKDRTNVVGRGIIYERYIFRSGRQQVDLTSSIRA